jgi:SAM-dependent methyltransferase
LIYEVRQSCSLCGHAVLENCLSLPDTPLANEFVFERNKTFEQIKFPLSLVICERCHHLQSSILVPPSRLFDHYVYETSTSPVTIAHLRDQARTIDAVLGLRRKEKSFVVEIGSNDGALLQQFADLGIPKANLLGIEPARSIAEAASKKGLRTHIEFFTHAYAKCFRQAYTEPDVVVANNVLAHVPNVKDALLGVKEVLGDTGVLVMEVAHARDLLHGAWDTIYHEHLSHHAFTPLMGTLQEVGLPVFDVDVVDGQVGRGSLRVWAGCPKIRTSEADRKIQSLLRMEDDEGLLRASTWYRLEDKIMDEKRRVSRALQEYQGMEVWGYGAPAKMTTLCYAYQISKMAIRAVVDDSPLKQGLFTPGTHWPVVEIDELVKANPDLVIAFAWNFVDDVRRKLREKGYTGPVVTPQELAR